MEGEQISNEQEITISWIAPEFTFYQKGSAWFVVLVVITATFFIIAVLMRNYIFALLILLLSFLVCIQAVKKPSKIKIVISEKGLKIKENFFPYGELKSFWLFEEPEIRILSIESKKSLLRHRITIPLADKNPCEIRQILAQFIPEKKQEEMLADAIARKLKF